MNKKFFIVTMFLFCTQAFCGEFSDLNMSQLTLGDSTQDELPLQAAKMLLASQFSGANNVMSLLFEKMEKAEAVKGVCFSLIRLKPTVNKSLNIAPFLNEFLENHGLGINDTYAFLEDDPEYQGTLCHAAAYSSDPEVLKLLLDKNAAQVGIFKVEVREDKFNDYCNALNHAKMLKIFKSANITE